MGYMPALVAIRFNPPCKAKDLALHAAGKPAKVAIVLIMRKLLITANSLLRDTANGRSKPLEQDGYSKQLLPYQCSTWINVTPGLTFPYRLPLDSH